MPSIFNTAYLAFVNRRIQSLEAEQAQDRAFQEKHALDAKIEDVLAQIRANDLEHEVDGDRERWLRRRVQLEAKLTKLDKKVVPLPEASKKLLLKLRTYKLRRHVCIQYQVRKREIEDEVAMVDHTSIS